MPHGGLILLLDYQHPLPLRRPGYVPLAVGEEAVASTGSEGLGHSLCPTLRLGAPGEHSLVTGGYLSHLDYQHPLPWRMPGDVPLLV